MLQPDGMNICELFWRSLDLYSQFTATQPAGALCAAVRYQWEWQENPAGWLHWPQSRGRYFDNTVAALVPWSRQSIVTGQALHKVLDFVDAFSQHEPGMDDASNLETLHEHA